MTPVAPLLPWLLSAMAPSVLAMAVDCAPTPPSPDSPVPWIKSWIASALQDRFSVLFPPNAPQVSRSPAPGSGHEEPLQAVGEGKDPGFCPL